MSEYQIVPSSPRAKREVRGELISRKYPFHDLEAGQSFIVDLNDAKDGSIRSIASQLSKSGEKKFRVVRHVKEHILEVARLK